MEMVVGNVCDNCLFDYNPSQQDSDENGIGDVCQCDTRSDYLTYLDNNENVQTAFDEYDIFIQNYFWCYIDELEDTGEIVIAAPDNFDISPSLNCDDHNDYCDDIFNENDCTSNGCTWRQCSDFSGG